MRLQAYNDNGTMKFRQVSGSQALDSLPVGTTIGTIRTGGVIPNGYLEADGSTFDVSKYPELYSILGSDTLPELFDHSSQIRYDLADTFNSRVWYTAPADGIIFGNCEGPFINEFRIRIRTPGGTTDLAANQLMLFNNYNSNDWGSGSSLPISKGWQVYVESETVMTQYFAPYDKHLLIKAATIGIADISINAIKGELTYSTEETLTGKTWVDGKPIYRRVFNWTSQVGNSTHFEIPYLNTMVDCGHIVRDDSSNNAAVATIGFHNRGLDTCYLILNWQNGASNWTSTNGHWWVEYTKQ